MKKIAVLIAMSFIGLMACKNNEQQEKLDAMQKELIKGHDEVMPMSMKIPKLKTQLLESVEGLEETDEKLIEARRVAVDLTRANDDMYNWMDNFSEAINNTEDLNSKEELFVRLQEEIDLISESTKTAMEAANNLLKEDVE